MFEEELKNIQKASVLSMLHMILSHFNYKRVPIEQFEDVSGWEVRRTFDATPGGGWLVQFSVSRQAVAKCLMPDLVLRLENALTYFRRLNVTTSIISKS